MPTALIVGGSGKVARHLTALLVQRSYKVHSLIRSASQTSSLESLGATPIVQSIETITVSDLTSAIKRASPDVIIWSAGAGRRGGPQTTHAVDYLGAVKTFDAAAAAGVKRLIVVSAMDVRDRQGKPVPAWYSAEDRAKSDKGWSSIGAYYAAKLAADRDLVSRNGERAIEYTIVRPGLLSDEQGTGRVQAGKIALNGSISRQDVAAVVVAAIEDEGTIGLAFDILSGDVPVKDAVGKVAQDRIDTFNGYY